MRRAILLLGITAVFAGGAASASAAAGAPILLDDAGLRGVPTTTGFRYVAIEGGNQSVVARISPTQRIVAVRFLPGRFTIPAVANDGSSAGLSGDGKTLVLIRPRVSFPRAQTSFLILDPSSFRVHREVTLRGDFSFDAISADGSTLYFIQYTSATDPTHYAVRAFDVASGTLDPEAIVDKTEPDEDMRGNPITRVTSPNGRWAYTLYDGGGGKPFVHALDTVGRQAHCIDLDALAGKPNLPSMRLRLGNGTLSVTSGSKAVLAVDTATFRVSRPGATSGGDDGVSPWIPIGGASFASLLALGALSLFVRRRRLATT
jgi:hypothetical protein